MAARELRQFRRRGAAGTTRALINAIREDDARGLSLLDIGGGVGVIQHVLATAGVAQLTSVDASPAYLSVQQREAEHLEYADRAAYLAGDFVTLSDEIPWSDIVTLDRVICCYPDMQSQVTLSAERAGRLYAVVYPRGTWWSAVGFVLVNLLMKLRRTPFRAYLHPPVKVDAAIRAQGLRPRFQRETLLWTVAVYAR